MTVSGPVRTLRALEIGLRGMRERALVVSVEVSILRVGKETPLPEGGPGWVAGGGEGEDASGLKVQVTLGAAEYGKAMEKLAGEPGVTTLAAPGMVVRLFQTAMMTVGGRRVAMLAVPLGHDRVVLHAGMDSGEVGGPELPAYEVAVWLGSGMGGLLRREVDDGVECGGMVPKLKDASWEEPGLELPRGVVARETGGKGQHRPRAAQAQQPVDAGAVHPAGRPRVPGPAATPLMRRGGIDIGGYDIGLDLVAGRRLWGQRVVDGVEQRKQPARRIAIAQPGMGQHRPHRGMAVLTAILAQTGRIALDIAGVQRRAVEGRGEQQCKPRIGTDQMLRYRCHGAARPIRLCRA